MSDAERIAYRPPEVARLLGVSRSLVYGWVARGIVPTIRVGGTVLIPREAFEAWLREQTQTGRGRG